jgi:hypothetical protein
MSFLLELLDEALQARDEVAPAGLQHPALDVAEAAEVHPEEILDALLGGGEARLDLSRRRAQGRCPLRAGVGRGGPRLAQEAFAGEALLGAAVGREEGLGFLVLEGVAADDLCKTPLLPVAEGAERHGHREGERSAIEAHLELRRQPPPEGEPPLDPGLLPPEEFPDRRGREPVRPRERLHDARLVHGARGLLGRVGLQKAHLARHAAHRLDDDRHLAASLRAPAGQALEAVEDFQGAILLLGDAQGHGGEVAFAVGALAAQGGEAGPEALDGHGEDESHRQGSSRGRIW